MTFAPTVRKFKDRAFASGAQEETETRTGVTLVGRGKTRTFVATVRQDKSLVFLGKGTMEECIKLYDAAKAAQGNNHG